MHNSNDWQSVTGRLTLANLHVSGWLTAVPVADKSEVTYPLRWVLPMKIGPLSKPHIGTARVSYTRLYEQPLRLLQQLIGTLDMLLCIPLTEQMVATHWTVPNSQPQEHLPA